MFLCDGDFGVSVVQFAAQLKPKPTPITEMLRNQNRSPTEKPKKPTILFGSVWFGDRFSVKKMPTPTRL
jgi:hypothetical protein